ncbi:carbon storage regulator [Neobacillus sp. K501]
MLIVGREIGQSVIICDVIKVTVLQIDSKVCLSIDAPKHIRVSQHNEKFSMKDKLKKGAKVIGSSTIIGDCIKITILQTESGLLRIAIDAPKEISIFREELYKGNQIFKHHIVQAL